MSIYFFLENRIIIVYYNCRRCFKFFNEFDTNFDVVVLDTAYNNSIIVKQ